MNMAKVSLGAHLMKRKKGSCAFASADKISFDQRLVLPFGYISPPVFHQHF